MTKQSRYTHYGSNLCFTSRKIMTTIKQHSKIEVHTKWYLKAFLLVFVQNKICLTLKNKVFILNGLKIYLTKFFL